MIIQYLNTLYGQSLLNTISTYDYGHMSKPVKVYLGDKKTTSL